MLTEIPKCIICDSRDWISLLELKFQFGNELKATTYEEISASLQPLHTFNLLVKEKFAKECSRCQGMPLICLIGRTGSGKSTLFNMLLGRKVSIEKGSLGLSVINFYGAQEQDISLVGQSLNSVTNFPIIRTWGNSILVDFPGFMDTRKGSLEIIQHFLLHLITEGRKHKLIICKDIRRERDAEFISFLNSDFIHAKSCLVVFTKCDKRHNLDFNVYSEGRMKKPLEKIYFPMAEKGTSYWLFVRSLNKAIGNLWYSSSTIEIHISTEIYKFQQVAMTSLLVEIDLAFFKILSNGLEALTIEPYNVSFFRNIIQGKFTLSEAYAHISEVLTTGVTVPTSLLKDWNLVSTLSNAPVKHNWNTWSPSSHEVIVTFNNRLNSYSSPKLKQFTDDDLLTNLLNWHSLVHRHYLEHVCFRARGLLLAESGRKGDNQAYQELIRLSDFRQEIYEKMLEVWKPLEAQFMRELEKEESQSDDSNLISTLRLKDSKFVLNEILRFTTQNSKDLAQAFKVIARQLSGVALADGSIAIGAYGAKIAGTIAAGTALESTFSSLLYLTSTLFGTAVLGAVGAFAYHLYLTNRQLQKIRAIGFDFSFLKVEASFWSQIRNEALLQNSDNIVKAFKAYDSEFRLLMASTEKGVIKAKKKLAIASANGVELGNWGTLIEKVEIMTVNIFLEIKARGNSLPGCYFKEHHWNTRSFLSFQWLTPKSCCTFFATKLDLECQNCQYLCHNNSSCLLYSLQHPCSSYILGQSLLETQKLNPIKAIKSIEVLVEAEKKQEQKREELLVLGNLCNMIYDDSLSSLDNNEDLLVFKEDGDNIKYAVAFNGNNAYVIIRGTDPYSLPNWTVNASAKMVKVKAGNLEGEVHQGYWTIAERIYNNIWQIITARKEVQTVFFSGHSLGGAISHCLNFKSIISGQSIPCFSVCFGSPLVFDESCSQLLKKKAARFLTFVNRFDLVPGIMLNLGSLLQDQAFQQGGIGEIASPLVGILTRHILKKYHPVGSYVFKDSASVWETNDAALIFSRLMQNKPLSENLPFHSVEEYIRMIPAYLEVKNIWAE